LIAYLAGKFRLQQATYMAKRYVLGIDSGISAVNAVLATLRGVKVCVRPETTPVECPHESCSEFDLQTDWLRIADAVRHLLSDTAIDPEDIPAAGVTGRG